MSLFITICMMALAALAYFGWQHWQTDQALQADGLVTTAIIQQNTTRAFTRSRNNAARSRAAEYDQLCANQPIGETLKEKRLHDPRRPSRLRTVFCKVTLDYSFTAQNGERHTGTQTITLPTTVSGQQFKAGTRVDVQYLPDDPQTHLLRLPK